ncbi:hypothetical protein FDF58_08205 [Clostridium argentinense]|uniref:hypothetical protein n=1 Tax=Clostridium argentinense TaxID=29341 RepID=UPI00126A2AB6|nr:hypothetical protein [Clostridium argentinense]NFP52296.1 hypothetical protein [Clostridium argentinense]NFP72340.1 hypothetical protein [Clostridium argentinense]NFP76511.1 hypothetical protein [Clostridium argentinense]
MNTIVNLYNQVRRYCIYNIAFLENRSLELGKKIFIDTIKQKNLFFIKLKNTVIQIQEKEY